MDNKVQLFQAFCAVGLRELSSILLRSGAADLRPQNAAAVPGLVYVLCKVRYVDHQNRRIRKALFLSD